MLFLRAFAHLAIVAAVSYLRMRAKCTATDLARRCDEPDSCCLSSLATQQQLTTVFIYRSRRGDGRCKCCGSASSQQSSVGTHASRARFLRWRGRPANSPLNAQAKFAKCMRDCKALDRRLTPTEVDITFARVSALCCAFYESRLRPHRAPTASLRRSRIRVHAKSTSTSSWMLLIRSVCHPVLGASAA